MEKERKPAGQTSTGVHGKDNKSGLGLGCFIEFCHNEAKAKATFGVSVAALDGVALTGVPVHLPLEPSIGFGGLSAAQGEPREADSQPAAIELVGASLIDFVGEDRSRIAAKFAQIVLHGGLQIAAFIEIAPACLLQISITIHHRKVQFLPELGGIRALSTLDRPNMRLLQTDDTVLQTWVLLSNISFCWA